MRDLEWNVFGERLSKELEKKQLSYRQFAEMVGITTTTVFRYAKCERIPRANEIIKTADVLGVTCDYLLGLSDDPHKTLMSYVIAQPEKEQLSKESTTSDLISRQEAVDALDCINGTEEVLRSLPSAQPEYEPADVEDFAKTMSENTLYNFMAWNNVAFTLMNEMGFVICKKTM